MNIRIRDRICWSKTFAAFILACGVAMPSARAGDQPVMLGFPVFVPPINIIPVQEDGGEGGEGSVSDAGGGVNFAPSSGALSQAANVPQAIGQALRNATKFCSNLPGNEYAIDCLAYEYWEIQKQLPDYGQMAEVKQVLAETSKKLRKLATDNQSRAKRPVRVTKGKRKFNRTIVPVERAKLPRLSREASAIINNGATLLIRASGDSNRKRAQYQQIARSMQTGAIMLRSL